MIYVIYIISTVVVVSFSAIATYAINISRERLWLRSKKTEEIYYKADELSYNLSFFFKNRYNLVDLKTFPRDSQDVRALNCQLSELNVLVGLYLPGLGESLSRVLAATSSAFHWLGIAEAGDEVELEHAFHSLDFSVSETTRAFEQFKKDTLLIGSIDQIGGIYDAVLNRKRMAQSGRILALSAQ